MKRRCGTVQVPTDHPALPGHFPGNPIVPGVVLLDEVLHLIESERRDEPTPSRWHIGNVKFHRLVLPEQPLTLECVTETAVAQRFELRFEGALVASGTVRVAQSRRSLRQSFEQ